jgi:hypothetical protein
MVYIKNGLIFIVPRCEQSQRFFKEEEGTDYTDKPYMVGVFVDQQAAQ